MTTITVDQSTVSLRDVQIMNQAVADYFRRVAPENLHETFIRAVEVGTFCLERAGSAQDLEFVRRKVEELMSSVEKSVAAIPLELESALLAKIGTSEGQILAPVQSLITHAVRGVSDRLGDLRSALSEIDPTKESSPAGRVVHTLRDLLDSKRSDSVQGTLSAAVNSLVASDGTLASTVQKTVESALKPLRDELDQLAKEVRGQEAASVALSQTTAKGLSFEEQIVSTLQSAARHNGMQVHHVGSDNRPGDLIVLAPGFGASSVRIVIEAKDQQVPKGRKAIADVVAPAMAERQASCAVYVSRESTGLANEIGEWPEGECERGPFVACTYEHLTTALRFLVAQKRLMDLRSSHQEFDSGSVVSQVTRIRTALERIKNINRKTSDIRNCASDIETEGTNLRSEIRDALSAVEEVIKHAAKPMPPTSNQLVSVGATA